MLHFVHPEGPAWVFLVVAGFIALIPLVLERVRVPGIIGLLAAGLVIGPHGLKIVVGTNTAVSDVGQIGLLYLMFLAGLELDLEVLRKYRNRAVGFGLLTFAVPLVLGTVTGVGLGYSSKAALLLGSIFASHTLIAYPEARRLGVTADPAVAVTVGATVLTDTLALVVLAAVAGATVERASATTVAGRIVIGLGLLLTWCFVVLPRVVRWTFTRLQPDRTVRYAVLLTGFLSAAVVADVVGIEGIVGAFFAGLALNRLVPNGGPLMERIEFFGGALFIPIFLMSVGLVIDPAVLIKPATLGIAAAFAGACVGGKAIAAVLTRFAFGWSWPQVGAVLGLSVAQAAATLAATFVGFEIHLLSEETVNAVLVVIVVSLVIASFLTPAAAGRIPIPPMEASTLGRHVLLSVLDPTFLPVAAAVASPLARADGGLVVTVLLQGADGPLPDLSAARSVLDRAGLDCELFVRICDSPDSELSDLVREHRASIVVTDVRVRALPAPSIELYRASGAPLRLAVVGAGRDRPLVTAVAAALQRGGLPTAQDSDTTALLLSADRETDATCAAAARVRPASVPGSSSLLTPALLPGV